jgi:hypothetical protein
MTEYPTSTQDADVMPGASASAETIDLLIRHLETAKRIASSSPDDAGVQDDKAFPIPDVLCTLLYVVPGTLCPLLYVHVPTVAEASPTE